MDLGLAIGPGRGLDGEPDVGSGIQLSDDVEAQGLDDILERAAGIDGSTHRASTDGQELVTRSGALAAKNNAAAVPTSGPTRVRRAPRPHSSMRRARNVPIASGAIIRATV